MLPHYTYQPTGAYVTFADLMATRRLAARKKLLLKRGGVDSVAHEIGQGMEYAEVRPYSQNDDARHIDWRVTARKRDTHIKVFHEQFDNPVYAIIDQGSSLFFGSQQCFKSVIAACVAARFFWQSHLVGHPVGASICGGERYVHQDSRASERHIINLCQQLLISNHALGIATHQSRTKLEQALQAFAPIAARYGSLLVISDFFSWDGVIERVLLQLAQQTSLQLALIFDPLEAHLPTTGNLSLTDTDTFLSLQATRKKTRLGWDAIFANRLNAMQTLCNHNGIRLHCFSTAEPLTA